MRLFEMLELGACRISNRVMMSPMSRHAAGEDGRPTDWHLVHYGSRAAGGCGLIMVEDTAVEPDGRTSHGALGLYQDDQGRALERIADFCHAQGARIGIQLAHAGRKAYRDTRGDAAMISASGLAFADGWHSPVQADPATLTRVLAAFARAARLALEAGFDVLEVHAAHGYLLHQFLSPLTNHRKDAYGGSCENRARLLVQTIQAVRTRWPAERPLFVRLAAGDGGSGGSTGAQMTKVAGWCAREGADLIDVTGGTPLFGGAQVERGETLVYAQALHEDLGIPFAIGGGILDGRSAEELLQSTRATLVSVGRPLLSDPYWTLSAARELGVELSLSAGAPATLEGIGA